MKPVKKYGSVSAIIVMLAAGCVRHAPVASPPHQAQSSARKVKLSKAPTADQKLGIKVFKSLTSEKGLRGSNLSVGTNANNVILNGRVISAAQKALAERVVRSYLKRDHARSYKIINDVSITPVTKPKA